MADYQKGIFMLKLMTVARLQALTPQTAFIQEDSYKVSVVKRKKLQPVLFINSGRYLSIACNPVDFDNSHFLKIQSIVKQLISSFLFFQSFYIPKEQKNYHFNHFDKAYFVSSNPKNKKSNTFNRHPFVALYYYLKDVDNKIHYSPELVLTTSKSCFRIYNYNHPHILNLCFSMANTNPLTGVSSPISIDSESFKFDINNLESSFAAFHNFCYNLLIKPLIDIDSKDFSKQSFKLIKMALM